LTRFGNKSSFAATTGINLSRWANEAAKEGNLNEGKSRNPSEFLAKQTKGLGDRLAAYCGLDAREW
jgi:hypothetical protein